MSSAGFFKARLMVARLVRALLVRQVSAQGAAGEIEAVSPGLKAITGEELR